VQQVTIFLVNTPEGRRQEESLVGKLASGRSPDLPAMRQPLLPELQAVVVATLAS
jgi:hypothetical protein